MKYEIAIGIAMAITLLTSIAIANNNYSTMMQGTHASHHQGNGTVGMNDMMNGVDMQQMHEQCKNSMPTEVHAQCESMMGSSSV